MRPDDVSPFEMSRSGASDAFEHILAGRAHSEQGEAPDVKRFVDDVKAAFKAEEVPAAVESRHLAAIVEAAHLIAEKGEPAVRPVSKALGPAWQASGLPKRRRDRVTRDDVKRRLLRSPVGKVAAAMVALFTIFSGVALAGALPAPVQEAVANVADTVGIHLPSPADDETAAGDDQGQDENADDQGEDEQVGVQGEDSEDQADARDSGATDTTEADDQGGQGQDSDEQGDENDQGESAGDQGNQDEQGDGSGPETHESDDPGDQGQSSDEQGEENDQGDHQTSGGGNDQGDEGNQGDQGGDGD